MPEKKIERYDIFVVKEKSINEKGNLVGKTTKGTDFTVGAKRSELFDIFEVGAEVKVGYAKFQNAKMPNPIEYIATAEQTGKHVTLEKELPPEEKEHLKQEYKRATEELKSEKMSKEDWADKDARTRRSIERQKSAELAVLTLNAGKITEANFEKLADKIYNWISKAE